MEIVLFALGCIAGILLASCAFYAAQRLVEPYKPLQPRLRRSKPIVLDPDTMYLAEDKAERLRAMTGAIPDEG